MKDNKKFVKMLNYGLANELIEKEEAISMLCSEMPLKFHKGSWEVQENGGVMTLKKRLVAWYKVDGHIRLRDIYNIL